ncbi:MAG TPA: FxSxx-COOH system tetratricopeptide repeat protein [Actinophytocola sp.]|nr:FxSxx-COOH system tetratricopeptide repeat protein [Actinophytocola sp.]HET9139008.1 FxSxx-COOH system tetratricopeptide repeat protein [Actinophytocola sp.]
MHPWELADALWLTAVTGPGPEPGPAQATHRMPADPPTPQPEPVGAGERPDSAAPPPEAGPATGTDPAPEQPVPDGQPATSPLFRLPSPANLSGNTTVPDALGVIRALRPLKSTVRSWRPDAVVLDEVATAERAAEDGLWWPEIRPETERFLDLTLVVDDGPSMALWRHRLAAFIALLEQVGAFRTIRVRLLDTTAPESGPAVPPTLRGATAGAAVRSPSELLDPSGRRIVMVVTDGVAPCWRQGLAGPLLTACGQVMPVAVLNLLPQRLWQRVGLPVYSARLRATRKLQPNKRWTWERLDTWLDGDAPDIDHTGIPVPVLELRPRWLRWWAGLLMNTNHQRVGPVLLAQDVPTVSSAADEPLSEISLVQQVDEFRGSASAPAFRLATLLAAVPVSLTVARHLQAQLIPEAGPEHIAEVFTSGLLHPVNTHSKMSTWDALSFDIPNPIREKLLAGCRRSDTAAAVRVAAACFAGRHHGLTRLRDAIAEPDNAPDPDIATTTLKEVQHEQIVLRALTGPYLPRARRLDGPTIDSPATMSPVNQTSAPSEPTVVPEDSRPPLEPLPSTSETPDPYAGPPASALGVGRSRERHADEVPPIWGNVPPRNPNFTGRADLLDNLSQRLTAGGTTAVLPAALHGMGGIGKTQMAVEYIYRHLRDYDVIWWIPAAEPTQIRAGLTELARQLRLSGHAEASTAVPAVREALRVGQPFRRWLLVFDAAESPETVRPFFPSNGPGEILITSRNPDWAGIARPLEVSVFRREESIELLRRRGPEISDSEADLLAEKLGDLPLAIEQAAAWRAETGMQVQEYLRLFDEKVAEILDTSAPQDYELSVAAAWNVSFDELLRRNTAAHHILHLCAFFSPDPITRDLFTGVRGIAISPELDVALRDPMQLARAIRDINRYGLAKIDHGNNTIQLHRLVQLVLRNRVTSPQLQAQMRHGAHQLLANLDPNDPESSRHWPRYRELLPHAYAADVIDCDDSWARQLVINLMRYLFQWGDHEEATTLAQRALEGFTAKLGQSHPQTMDVASRLGLYLWGVGRYAEAADLNKRTLKLRIEASGETSEETLSAQGLVAIDLRAQGDFAASRKLTEEIHEKARKLFGPDDPETLNAAYQHALSLRLSGDYRAAAQWDADTHRRRIEVLGLHHPRTLSVYGATIVDRREAGEYLWARAEQQKLVDIMWQRYGEDHIDTWTTSFLLAVAIRKDGDHPRALPLSGPALRQFQIRYGDDHPTTMAAALAHSIDLRHSGDLRAARKLGEETFERYRRILGEHHPHTLGAMVDLAVALRLLGDTAGARELDERALEQLRARVGPDHPYAVVAAINLASDLIDLGEAEAAGVLDEESVDRAGRVLGNDHPTTIAALLNLSIDLRAVGRTKDAQARAKEATATYRKVLGDRHPATIAAAEAARANCDIDPMLM